MPDQKEELLESKTVYHGKKFDVNQDTLRFPNGKTGTRDVIRHHGSVCLVCVKDGQVYFVRQSRHAAADELLLELPAGTIDPGEKPEESARREIQEEIGMAAGTMTFLFEGYVSPGYTDELQRYYLMENLAPQKAEADEDEFLDVVTLSWADALAAVDRGEFRDTKTVAGLLNAARKLGVA